MRKLFVCVCVIVCACVFTLTVVFGAPSGGADDLQGSLDAALCAAAALHTAWPPLAQPPQAQTDPHTDTDEAGAGEASQHLGGVTARLLYLTPDYNVLEIPAAALQVGRHVGTQHTHTHTHTH